MKVHLQLMFLGCGGFMLISYSSRLWAMTVLLTLTQCVSAMDHVRLLKSQSDLDNRETYKNDVLRRALEITVPEYGAFVITIDGPRMSRKRALTEIKTGELVNVYMSPASSLWNENTIVIKVPIRRGLLSYRLLLVHKTDLPKFKNVKTAEDLRFFRVGLQTGWEAVEIFNQLGFQTVITPSYDGLFKMLDVHRFDFIPRGINDVFDELDSLKTLTPNIVIEPTLALYIVQPTYVYVSLTEPRLAQRIAKGLSLMVESGELKKIFYKSFGAALDRAKLSQRRMIKIDNPLFEDEELLKNKKMWFEISESRE